MQSTSLFAFKKSRPEKMTGPQGPRVGSGSTQAPCPPSMSVVHEILTLLSARILLGS